MFRWLFSSKPSELDATTTNPPYGAYVVYLSHCSNPLDYWEYTTGSFSKMALSPHSIQLLPMILSWDVSKRYLFHLRVILTPLNAVLRYVRISIMHTVLVSSSLDLTYCPWATSAKKINLILSSVLVRDPPQRKL